MDFLPHPCEMENSNYFALLSNSKQIIWQRIIAMVVAIAHNSFLNFADDSSNGITKLPWQ